MVNLELLLVTVLNLQNLTYLKDRKKLLKCCDDFSKDRHLKLICHKITPLNLHITWASIILHILLPF